MLTELPAVERVDRALVAIEDELDLLAAPCGLAARAGTGRTLAVEPFACEPGAHGGRLMAGERARTGAEPAAHTRRGDAATACADIRRDERPLGMRVGTDGARQIAGRTHIHVEILTQVGELVLVFEEPRLLRAAAGLKRALRRRDGLRLHDGARLLLDLRCGGRRFRLLGD